MSEPPALAILAKAPVPGLAKTRLIPALGPEGAAELQARLIVRTVETALAARLGRLTLWGAPAAEHPLFARLAGQHGLLLQRQPEGDLGRRMLAAFEAVSPLILIGTDCPCLTPDDLRDAVAALGAADAVIAPAEDGGYGLIGARAPFPVLFEDVPWSTERVADTTRHRAAAGGLRLAEIRTIWDVDTPADLDRLRRHALLPG
jgi:uncharacterized protein